MTFMLWHRVASEEKEKVMKDQLENTTTELQSTKEEKVRELQEKQRECDRKVAITALSAMLTATRHRLLIQAMNCWNCEAERIRVTVMKDEECKMAVKVVEDAKMKALTEAKASHEAEIIQLKEKHQSLLRSRAVLALQELRLKSRLVLLSAAFSRWQLQSAQLQAMEQENKTIASLQKQHEDEREALRVDLTNQLEKSRKEVSSDREYDL